MLMVDGLYDIVGSWLGLIQLKFDGKNRFISKGLVAGIYQLEY